ncbi:TetR/AcrR family transcriptional regulator [Actinomadura sp. WMMB 499]|uniref:TetR/AcrR family transcriptional regulator n=1 Tax=Actinomadura sp. WMMB 499 TaxID=1219491 RepID=UPI00124547AC|nr:TetR family transcriptional regulator [Actinomadura sp. WMMB 499]QFG25494.1 helix-turn-helix transcriptional regulator [Actinomadura sp. WMMB 499]
MGYDRAELRERKKERIREAISEAAITLFAKSGFDGVTFAEIAAAAEVSKPTPFAYFPPKEDLVLHRLADNEDEPATVVRGRAPGVPPLAALRRHFLDGLDRREPVTGLNDDPRVLTFRHLLYSTQALITRLTAYMLHSEAALADALAEIAPGEDTGPRVAAAQIFGTQQILGDRNVQDLRAGLNADAVPRAAIARAAAAFDLLEGGLASRFG